MDTHVITESIEIAGRTLTFETGRLAQQATASVLARYGETVVLATVVMGEASEETDFFPLTVDYEERLYAGGLIKGSPWVKREGRPRDEAILSGRVIDRSIRPLFPNDFRNEVQVIVTVFSVDHENDPEILGLVAVSAALELAGAPWVGPVGGIRVGKVNGTTIFNPLVVTEQEYSQMDLVVSSTLEKVVMLEMGAEEVSEEDILSGIEAGFEKNKEIIAVIKKLAEKVGVTPFVYAKPEEDVDLTKQVKDYCKQNFDFSVPKVDDHLKHELIEKLIETFEGKLTKSVAEALFEKMRKEEVRRLALVEGKRLDDRPFDQVRPLSIEVGLLPRTHGSALFQRGETQALTITTLGSTSLEQLIESMTGEETKRYIHHYNFPPYSTGEVGRIGTPKRREIGHGALAERALEPVIPSEETFPYTIRIVSEILSSNGSTSMASVCGSTLSLMDAGVPLKEPVAGIAMGLMENEEKTIILTDLSGQEDFAGYMDFKVAGSKNGVTAVQLDVKNHGLSLDLIRQIFDQAKVGRMFILGKMLEVIKEPRGNLSQYAPKVVSVKIDPSKIGEVIGPGGKIIKALQLETTTVISIEENGTVYITGTEEEGLEMAKKRIEGITKETKAGEIYDGVVKRIVDFGAFVEYFPGREGLVHISEITDEYVKNVHEHLKEGDEVQVKVMNVDEKGRVNLSIRRATQI